MGLFGSDDVEIDIPPQVTEGMNFLASLLGQAPTIPRQQIAGLSPAEQQAQESLSQLLGMPPTGEGFAAASSELMRTVGGIDITQDPFFGAAAQTALEAGQLETNRVGRGLQLTGNLSSTSGRDVLGRSVAQTQSNILNTLAPFAEAERGRQFAAAGQLAGLDALSQDLLLNQINAGATVGAQPRLIEQATADAEFRQQLQQVLFPFDVQAGIASNLVSGGGQFATISGGDPSLFSQIAPVLGMAALGFASGGAGTAAAGSGASAGSGFGGSFVNPMAVYGSPTNF